MLYSDLVRIMQLRNRRTILKAVKKLGYKNAAKNKKFKTLPFTALCSGSEDAYGDLSDKNGTAKFKGSLFTEVEGVEQFEFFVLQTNCYTRKHDFKMYHLDIWYKEIEL